MQRSTDRHLWWDSIANYEVVRIIHEADGVLLCISVSGRNCGTTSKTHMFISIITILSILVSCYARIIVYCLTNFFQ